MDALVCTASAGTADDTDNADNADNASDTSPTSDSFYSTRSAWTPSPPVLQAQELTRRFDPTVVTRISSYFYGGPAASRLYAQGFWEAVLQALPVLTAPRTSLERVLACLSVARTQLAYATGTPNAGAFGRRREDDEGMVRTPVVGYRHVPGVRAFFSGLASGKTQRRYPDCLTQGLNGPRVQHNLHGVQVGMTQYTHISRAHALRYYGVRGGLFLSVLPSAARHRWVHGVNAPPGLLGAHLEALYQAARLPLAGGTAPERRSELCRRVGELHWWLSHACLYERGSAAITDMLSAALFEAQGQHRGRWKPGIMADVVALVTPSLDAFVDQYEGMLRKP